MLLKFLFRTAKSVFDAKYFQVSYTLNLIVFSLYTLRLLKKGYTNLVQMYVTGTGSIDLSIFIHQSLSGVCICLLVYIEVHTEYFLVSNTIN